MILEEALSTSRRREMDSFGRTATYHRVEASLSGDRLRALQLVNHGLAMVDDVLDSHTEPLVYLQHIQELFTQSFSGETVNVSTPDEQAVRDLGQTLKRLVSARFAKRALGRHTFAQVLSYWDMETRNIQRQGQILDRETLDEITIGIGSLVASQFLFILDPTLDYFELPLLTKEYGLAVKLADNLCDYREDIQRGFVNIPREDIHHVRGISIHNNQLTYVNSDKLALSMEYMKREYRRIQRVFDSADNLLLRVRLNRPIWRKGLDERLYLFGQLCHSWLKQTREFMSTETLRSYEHQDYLKK